MPFARPVPSEFQKEWESKKAPGIAPDLEEQERVKKEKEEAERKRKEKQKLEEERLRREFEREQIKKREAEYKEQKEKEKGDALIKKKVDKINILHDIANSISHDYKM